MPRSPVTLSALLLVLSFPLAAQTYRWVDDQGQVVYSQTPPLDGRNATIIQAPPPPPAGSAAQAQQRLDAFKQAEEEKRLQQGEAEALAKRETEVAEIRKKNCEIGRTNLGLLQTRPPNTLFRFADGSTKRFTAEEHAAELEKAQKIVDENCTN